MIRGAEAGVVEQGAELEPVCAAGRQPREFFRHLELVILAFGWHAGVAAEVQCADANCAGAELRRNADATLRRLEVRRRIAAVCREEHAAFVEEVAEHGGQRHHRARTARGLFARVRWQRQRRCAERVLQGALPVAAQHQRVIVVDVPVQSCDDGCVVVEPVVRDGGKRQRDSDTADDRIEHRGRIRTGAQALQGVGLEAGERLERIDTPAQLERSEVEELVFHDRAAESARELVLRKAG